MSADRRLVAVVGPVTYRLEIKADGRAWASGSVLARDKHGTRVLVGAGAVSTPIVGDTLVYRSYALRGIRPHDVRHVAAAREQLRAMLEATLGDPLEPLPRLEAAFRSMFPEAKETIDAAR